MPRMLNHFWTQVDAGGHCGAGDPPARKTPPKPFLQWAFWLVAKLLGATPGPLVALLRRIVDDGGFQVLLVTHRPELADAADVAYRFRLDEAGRTVATRVKSMEETLAEAEGAGV